MSKSEDNPDMKVLKKATCPTISGRSKLTYHVGATLDDEIHIRIHANDGGGMFSQEWVPFEAIQEVLRNDDEGAVVTSTRLTPWSLSDESLADAISEQARLMAGDVHDYLIKP